MEENLADAILQQFNIHFAVIQECFVTFEFDINMSIMYVTMALLYLY